MRYVELERREIDLTQFAHRAPAEEDCAEVIAEDTTILVAGVPLVVYRTNIGTEHEAADIATRLQQVKYARTVRTTKLLTQSRTLGFQPRNTIRRDFCTAAKLAWEEPETHARLCDYARKAVAEYQAYGAELLEKHLSVVEDRVREEFRIPGTPFTSGIVNKNNPLFYHFDSGNDHDVWSCMFCFRGKTDGGMLALPEFGVKVAIANRSLLMFDGQQILHGVTPILGRGRGAYRFTVVYYSRREMWNCLPLDEEVARIRMTRTSRERKRATGENRDELAATLERRRPGE